MTEIHFCILYCLKRINGERTISSIFHLFNGKRSGQTIQDGHVYSILIFFSLFKGMSEKTYYNYVKELCDLGYIKEKVDKIYILSAKGEKRLEEHQIVYPIPTYINGYLYGEDGLQFWSRLCLLVQTLSQFQNKSTTFVPIEENKFVQVSVRQFILGSPIRNMSKLSDEVGDELQRILSEVSELEATIFVMRLTGYKRVGFTYGQIAEQLNIDATRVYLLFINVIHYILHRFKNQKTSLLSKLYSPSTQSGVSESTKQTFLLLKQGVHLSEIARRRKLKESTIEDHIVELVVATSSINIFDFITEEEYSKIKDVIVNLKTNKLKTIKNTLGESISYFAIRLVLAKEGVPNGYE